MNTLPVVDVPTFEVVIPSTKETITMRPYLVSEERILLMAAESNNIEDMAGAVKAVLRNCILSKDVNLEALALFDLEYLFLKLRIHAVGEILELRFDAIPNTTCKTCAKKRELKVDLNEAKVEFPDETTYTNKIQINDKLGVILQWPKAHMLADIEKAKASGDFDSSLRIIWSCIDSIYDEEQIYSTKESTIAEGMKWLESLKKSQLDKIQAFFDNMPKLKQTVHINCKECGFHQEYTLEGLEDFFA